MLHATLSTDSKKTVGLPLFLLCHPYPAVLKERAFFLYLHHQEEKRILIVYPTQRSHEIMTLRVPDAALHKHALFETRRKI